MTAIATITLYQGQKNLVLVNFDSMDLAEDCHDAVVNLGKVLEEFMNSDRQVTVLSLIPGVEIEVAKAEPETA